MREEGDAGGGECQRWWVLEEVGAGGGGCWRWWMREEVSAGGGCLLAHCAKESSSLVLFEESQ